MATEDPLLFQADLDSLFANCRGRCQCRDYLGAKHPRCETVVQRDGYGLTWRPVRVVETPKGQEQDWSDFSLFCTQ